MVSTVENDVDCRKLFDSIVEDTDKLLQVNILETYRHNTISSINDRIDSLHKQIDDLGDEFIANVINNIKGNEEKAEKKEEKKDEKEKKDKKDKKTKLSKNDKLQEIQEIKNDHEREFYGKLFELQESIENAIRKTSLVEESVLFFKERELQNLIKLTKDNFGFKIPRNISKLFSKRASVDLEWSKIVKSSVIDIEDPSTLKITGTGCYTYYKTENVFTDEDVTVELEYKITTSDNYFYLGVINNSVVESSNCMCCTIANACYIQPGGDIICMASRKQEPKVKADKDKVHLLTIRLLGSDNEVYFKMDDNEEVGPFKIEGTNFRFVGGSCNTANGYIKIIDAYN